MILQTDDTAAYLRATPVIDFDHPSIRARAAALVQGSVTDVDRGRRLFEWVRDQIPHSADIGSELVTCSASEVLRLGTGICYAKSHLLAALSRSVGIPTGFCYQVALVSPSATTTALHGFTAMYLASMERWIRIDARGNTGEIDAQFGIDCERLAFPVDPEKGELFIYNMIFSDPVPEVVSALSSYRTRSELWRHLPPKIGDERLCDADRALNATLKLP